MINKKLKIGLLVDSENVSAWEYEMLKKIESSDYAEITLVIENNSNTPKQSFLQKIKANSKQLGFLMFSIIENKLIKVSPDAFERKNINSLNYNATKIKVVPKRTRFVDKFTKDDIEKIKKFDIDVFIRLGFKILKGDILTLSKGGVWSYHHGDNDINRGRPPGMWEFLEKWDTTGMILQILSEELDNGQILYKSHSTTNTNSWKRNKNNYYWKGVSFLPRKLEELHRIGRDAFFERVHEANKAPKFYSNRLYKVPKASELVVRVSKRYLSFIGEKVASWFYFNQWILMYKFNKNGGPSRNIYQFKKIIPPKNKFWADPFVLKEGEEYFVFFEEYLTSTKKGHISVLKIDRKGNYSEPEVILDKDYHLSYPFIFKEEDTIYMIPETRGNNSIELYKCVQFPNTWKLEKVLMTNVQAVDTTILKKDNTFWLFANIMENKGASTTDELFLFSSKNLKSDQWKSHPQNPIISDVRYARPAGNVFLHNNELYRPSQNGAKFYGHAMNISKIITLDEQVYQEEVVSSIFPNWEKNVKATHTLNFDGNLTVIDAMVKRRR